MATFRSTRTSIRASRHRGPVRPSPVVLVVEDNAELRHVLKETLGSEGWQVLAARDDSEATEVLRGTRVDLLISDLTDPESSEASLDTIRKEFPELPVVALSPTAGYHPTLFFGAWQSPRGYTTLSKPFRLAELIAVSREALASGTQASL
jgi:CheY-like chemotaxis protein